MDVGALLEKALERSQTVVTGCEEQRCGTELRQGQPVVRNISRARVRGRVG
jgi:hypothetical protein